jgi:hypothetical protein
MTNENDDDAQQSAQLESFLRARGIAKEIYAEYGGGEEYLRKERESFNSRDKSK